MRPQLLLAFLAAASLPASLPGCLSVTVDDDSSQTTRTGTGPGAAGPAQHPDTDVEEALDLTLGLDETTWSFGVEEGAAGTARVGLAGRFADPVAEGSLCVEWVREWGSVLSQGSTGDCARGGASVRVQPPHLEPITLLDWASLAPGWYSLTVRAGPQPNVLHLSVQVDNP